jgi:hypothetical protein
MISFGFEGSFAVNGFEAGAVFRGLSKTGRIETFFLAGTDAKAGAGTQGTETEAEAETGVALAAEIAGTIVGTVAGTRGTETKAEAADAVETFGTVGIVGITETTGAEAGTGVALGMEAFSCARLNKSSR